MVAKYPIHELLFMSADSYANVYEKMYFNWCENRCKQEEIIRKQSNRKKPDENLFQKYIANAPISKWYNQEYDILEQKFREMVEPQHGKLTIVAVREIYHSIVAQIFEKYPGALLISAESLTINSNSN